MSDLRVISEDPYLEHLKAARQASSVLKMQLATVRSDLPYIAIFAVEGEEDKVIYYQWISKVRPDLAFEFLICRNKRGVLQLSEALLKDATNLISNVFFLVDRDYDDLMGCTEHPALFMTDRYSIESYLVEAIVLDAVLKIEFNCHLRPEIRSSICALYSRLLTRFLELGHRLISSQPDTRGCELDGSEVIGGVLFVACGDGPVVLEF